VRLRVHKLLKEMIMYMTDQLADEFRITENFSASLSGRAWSLLREMTMRTGMTVPTLIETALRGYDRAWKESE